MYGTTMLIVRVHFLLTGKSAGLSCCLRRCLAGLFSVLNTDWGVVHGTLEETSAIG